MEIDKGRISRPLEGSATDIVEGWYEVSTTGKVTAGVAFCVGMDRAEEGMNIMERTFREMRIRMREAFRSTQPSPDGSIFGDAHTPREAGGHGTPRERKRGVGMPRSR